MLVLGDSSGSIMQKYNVDSNDVYIGPGRVKLEAPTYTTLFEGRILRARHDTQRRLVYLYCEDWLSQFNDRRDNYDMREDLDGAGLRESTLAADPTNGTGLPAETQGGNYYVTDVNMSWAADLWNGKYLLLGPGHAGNITITVGPSEVSFTGDALPVTETNDFDECWEDDGTCHEIKDNANFNVRYTFPILATEGSLNISGPSRAVMHITYNLEEDAGGDATFYFYNTGIPGYNYWDVLPATGGEFVRKSYTVPSNKLAHLITAADGHADVQITIGSAGANSEIDVDYCVMEMDVVQNGYSTPISITDTIAASHTLQVGTDVSIDGLGLFQGCPYCIVDKINTHIHALFAEPVDGAVASDQPGETDETYEATSRYEKNMTLLPAAPATGDCYYFGFRRPRKTLKLDIGQAGVGTWTITWRYSKGAGNFSNLSDVVDGTNGFTMSGVNNITWSIPNDWSTDTVGGLTLYWVRAIVTFTNMDTQPLGNQAWSFPLYPMDVNIDTNGAGISAENYQNMTNLEIAQKLTAPDKAVFWCALGGTGIDWKCQFNDGAPKILKDSISGADYAVLNWVNGEYDWTSVYNEYICRGVRIGDTQIQVNTSELGTDPGSDSKLLLGQERTQVYSSAHIQSMITAEDYGQALVERDEDVHLFLRAELAGLSAIRLGDELSVTSTTLGITAQVYVVTNWEYSSFTNKTIIELHPRVSIIGFQEHYANDIGINAALRAAKEMAIQSYNAAPYTQEW